jgi:hypothetical protein
MTNWPLKPEAASHGTPTRLLHVKQLPINRHGKEIIAYSALHSQINIGGKKIIVQMCHMRMRKINPFLFSAPVSGV